MPTQSGKILSCIYFAGKVIHYLVATGSLVICFLACIVALQLLNMRRKKKNGRIINDSENNDDQRNQTHNEPIDRGIYDEIDEVSGSVSEAIIRHSYMSIDSDQPVEYHNDESLPVDDYLIPCHSPTHDCKPNIGGLEATISGVNDYQNTKDFGDDDMENDESKKEVNSYVNNTMENVRPYYLLIEKRDMHDYADNCTNT